jgi:Flp pilus assembly pilin Flp
MIQLFKQLHNEESGQDIIEYVLIGAFISVVAIALIGHVGSAVSSYWAKLNSALT